MKKTLFISSITLLFCLSACQKEKIETGNNVNETFYVANKGAGMKVTVCGNTSAKVILLIVHGGPGGTASSYPMPVITAKYAVAYWDQRIAGSSQGGTNGSSVKLENYIDDTKKVIAVLKHRYGNNVSVFIFGHSWGGMLSTAFLTTDNNQQLLKGWVYCEGVHNFPLLNSLTKNKLLTTGISKITANDNVTLWQPIVDYCNSLSGAITADQSLKLNGFATKAESDLLKGVALEAAKYPKDVPPLAITSYYLNDLNPLNVELFKGLNDVELSSRLHLVTIPTLVVSAKFDFTTPSGLGDDLYSNISSTAKTHITLNNSGHDVQQWDTTMAEILKFIDANK